jgi:hypothetical protein
MKSKHRVFISQNLSWTIFMTEIPNNVDDRWMILAAQERCCDYVCYLFVQLQQEIVKCVC